MARSPIGTMGELFPKVPPTKQRIIETLFKDDLEYWMQKDLSNPLPHDVFDGEHPRTTLFAILMRMWFGRFKFYKGKSKLAKGSPADEIVESLMNLGISFITPDKPSGVGSRSKSTEPHLRDNFKKHLDDALSAMRIVERNLPDYNFLRARTVTNIKTVSDLLAEIQNEVTEQLATHAIASKLELFNFMQLKRHVKDESTQYVNELIQIMRKSGFKLKPNAKIWKDRIRKQPKDLDRLLNDKKLKDYGALFEKILDDDTDLD